ncbi:MAG: PilZ domain-containing protein [Acidobacteriota bacterium]|nr:PilZ domain-containing protein [Acidobacteriota bacterium]
MEPEGKSETPAVRGRRTRAHPRFAIGDEASLLLVNQGAALPCRILDLSQGGCRIHTQDRFVAGMMVRVEVILKLFGMPFRLSGVTQWTNRKHLVGVRFIDLSDRKREQLAQLIEELRAQQQRPADPAAAETNQDLPG